ncbi:hypothetical protein SAMN05421823_10566 [Catalinimonas alkaloidigena]|uniref:Spermatogenesis-associated protein 20-like TRX domain-containing protein n=1 Tax=Catalinimonas alkaloidigena TaxID=1075417 RepID=A0A1G9IQ64_9BACT|nr:thioredoxin domain-containing protein [Catalinimonas alkaloidigena]SDL27103.1 hypothetical protein SAMN05421823_10566 [Catalinimonas alkaloidigena]
MKYRKRWRVWVLCGALVSGCAPQQAQQPPTEKAEQNHLAQARSPYLRQHADNPVHWYEWGPEALAKAQDENKPLLISIGYAACHWCHVMEHESFMDTAVARVMNDHFVAIKVDREERPDVDQIYMEAAQLLSGRGGWPLHAFALPDGRPFYAGTYFPKAQWVEVLQQVAQVYREQHQKIVQQAEGLTQGIRTNDVITLPADTAQAMQQKLYEDLLSAWEPLLDFERGGFKGAPKFPLPVSGEWLLQYHYLTGDEKALAAVTTTLDAMAQGGMYDQIGGGFARYSTDNRWFVPHFEKMLYDNAQLVSLYAHAAQVTENPRYTDIVRETLAFVERELQDENGGFYASLNADSEGEEGKFYVWSADELHEALGANDAQLLAEYYGVTPEGNWEKGRNILYCTTSAATFAQKHGLTESVWTARLAAANRRLREVRNQRERPSTDDKILTGWNALMLKGYVDAYRALGDEAYLHTALRNAHFLEKEMLRQEGGLWRNYRDGRATIPAFLDDYALLADAWIALYQVTFDLHWLTQARALTDYVLAHFQDPTSGLFYYTSDQAENLIARKMELSDNVMPASNSVMAHVLFQLGHYYDQSDYLTMSRTMVQQVQGDLPDGGPYYANWDRLLGLMTYEPYEVAIVGAEAATKRAALQRHYLPTSLFLGGTDENLPLLENKWVAGNTLIYVCRRKVCQQPVTEPLRAWAQLNPVH